MRLNNEHIDYILNVLIDAQSIQRLFPEGDGCLGWVTKMISEMEMMLALRHRVQNHSEFNEIIETNFGWESVE